MGRLTILFLLVFVTPWMTTLGANDSLLVVTDCSLRPGEVGRISLQWQQIKTDAEVNLEVDAPAGISFLELPSTGNRESGSAIALFLVDPFVRAGAYQIQFMLLSKGSVIARSDATVIIKQQHGIESFVLEEKKASIKVYHINTGNVPLHIRQKTLESGQSTTENYERQNNFNLKIEAHSQAWDTSYVLSLKKRFYPHENPIKQSFHSHILNIGAHQQWSKNQSYSVLRINLQKDDWKLFVNSWNRGIRFGAGFNNTKYSLWASHSNTSPLELLRPSVGLFAKGNTPTGLYAFASRSSFGGFKRWEPVHGKFDLGAYSINEKLTPYLRFETGANQQSFRYTALGNLQELRGHYSSDRLSVFGRALLVPDKWQSQSLQKSNALIGATYRRGRVQMDGQSVFHIGTHGLQQIHNAQFQANLGRFEFNTRAMTQHANSEMVWSRGEGRARFIWGSSDLSLRYQKLLQKGAGRDNWMAQYNYRKHGRSLLLSAQKFEHNWNFRLQSGLQIGTFFLNGQAGLSSGQHNRWFHQIAISKSLKGQVLRLTSSRRAPVMISFEGQFLPEKNHFSLKGKVVNNMGEGIEGVVLRCEGIVVQSNASGQYCFNGLKKNNTLVRLDAESVPFAHFPKQGYEQRITLHSKVQKHDFACATNGGILGRLQIEYTQDIPLTSDLETTKVRILISNAIRQYRCTVDATGSFRLSGIQPGEYCIEAVGTGIHFISKKITVNVLDGEIVSTVLPIQEISKSIPIQRL